MPNIKELNEAAEREAFWGHLGADLGEPTLGSDLGADIPMSGAILISNPKKIVLKAGDSGAEVAKMHGLLVKAQKKIGDTSQTAMDVTQKFFGGATTNAVVAVQAASQLPQTGIVDEATWKALAKYGTNAAVASQTLSLVTKLAQAATPKSSSTDIQLPATTSGSSGVDADNKLPSWLLPVGAVALLAGAAGLYWYSTRSDQE